MLGSVPRRPRSLLQATPFLIASLALPIASGGCGGTRGASPRTAETAAGANYQAGESVQVEWQGSWYAATVLAVLECDHYRIHYEGWGSEWDEDVSRDRVRVGGSTPAAEVPSQQHP